MRILVVEDDADISTLISFHLKSHGFTPDCAYNGLDAIKMVDSGDYALVLLDILLPGLSGIEVLRHIRTESTEKNIPVIVTSAMTDEMDIIKALELGADDYITKPFSPRILIARVKSAIRRSEGMAQDDRVSTEGGLILEKSTRKAFSDGKEINLTATEFDTLSSLIRATGRVISRSEIIETIKGEDYPVTERSIDVQIASIRKKLGEKGQYIKTVWGIGYRYAEE